MEWTVNGLFMPPLLVELIQSGRWRNPGDDVIERVVPCLHGDAVDFLGVESMRFESSGHLADDPRSSRLYREVRGDDAKTGRAVGLPWRDVEKSFLVAVNREIGADVAIALDYRTDPADPRVIASGYVPKDGMAWREVAPTFSAFVRAISLRPPLEG
jgi:hypothetical protein